MGGRERRDGELCVGVVTGSRCQYVQRGNGPARADRSQPSLDMHSDHLCWAKHRIRSSDYLFTHGRDHALRE